MRSNPKTALIVIIALAALAAVFIYPKGYGAKILPWRLGLDLVGGSHLVYSVDLSQVAEKDRGSVLDGLRDVIERRVNSFGVAEPQVVIAKSGAESRLIVELAGILDISEAIRQIGETPFLDFREVRENGSSTEFIPTALTGRYLTVGGTQLDFDQTATTRPEINFELNEEGGKLFEEITRNNIERPICVFIDGEFIIPDSPTDSCPVVQGEISGGKARITGSFTIARAKEIVARFNAGALPAPITLINQQTVSAALGTDLLRKAIVAGIIGTALVMLFMILYYRTLGIFAALALLIYIPLTLAVFKSISVTMSLAGLAGFILTIGMAVDANILIFERMKEERKKGLSRSAILGEGFQRAWPSIRDSNVSTVITAIILYLFTSSFVRGFALNLLIGVLISMFSAIFVTRTFLRIFMSDKPKT